VLAEAQVLLLVARPLYMYCYCSDSKFLKNGKMNAYLGKKKKGRKESKSWACLWMAGRQARYWYFWTFTKGSS